MPGYDFGMASNLLYGFIWDEFCDWYLEAVKVDLYGDDEDSGQRIRHILYHCLTAILRLYNPVIPFVTEEIYREFPGCADDSLTIRKWPEPLNLGIDGKASVDDFTMLMKLIRATRNLKKEIGLPDSREVDLTIRPTPEAKALIEAQRPIFDSLSKAGNIKYIGLSDPRPEGALFNLVDGTEIYMVVGDIDALKAEFERLAKKVAERQKYIAGVERKLANEGFTAKAPEYVVEAEREKLASARGDLDELKHRFERMKDVVG